mmetsp:Transcript_1993/g.2845  ORF Transcript_1993/g.2845 Transcript_1993/m.2845 type:complete len:95 (+) Transcript_1993:21-305(+)
MSQLQQTKRYYIISNVALQGDGITKAGWPAKASSLEEALEKAQKYDAAAFHFYLEPDSAHGALYLFSSVNGVEERASPRSCMSVFMERDSVHKK